MWKAAAGTQINLKGQEDDDDWETDPDFVNDVNEQEQRWGSTTIEGSGRTAGAINMEQLRRETEESDALKKKQQLIDGPNSSFGYGGKFGVQKDRMDQSAVGHDYVATLEKHVSQKDYSTGFGGKYGVQTDRVDKSAVSWDHKEKIEKHASQKDYTSGFGGKFGVQTDRQDKSAVGWDHVEKVDKHESQKDYSVGFGGKFGVQTDRQDKSALGWDHHEAPQKHESQIDHKKGFGGKFGVQTDRMDKSAVTFSEEPERVGTVYTKVKPDIGNAKPSDLRAKFEHMSSQECTPVHSPAPRKTIHAKAAMFSNKENQDVLDNQQTFKQTEMSSPRQLDKSRIAQFTNENANQVQEVQQVQLQNLPNKEEVLPQEVEKNTQVYEEYSEVKEEIVEQEILREVEQLNQEDEIVDTGFTAVALYDYQAAADDEISFDPDDLITHVEMIDEGWWRGLCKGKHGLFPANYVHLQQ